LKKKIIVDDAWVVGSLDSVDVMHLLTLKECGIKEAQFHMKEGGLKWKGYCVES